MQSTDEFIDIIATIRVVKDAADAGLTSISHAPRDAASWKPCMSSKIVFEWIFIVTGMIFVR